MIDRALKLFGTDEPTPEQRRLTAGPVSATLEDGQLRWIKLGDAEVIRGIWFLIRDRNWSTCPPEVSNLRIEEKGGGFAVSFDALTRTVDGDLPWRAELRGTPDGTIRCEGVATPEKDFLTCRTGFVILHPLAGVVGRPMEIEHVDGAIERSGGHATRLMPEPVTALAAIAGIVLLIPFVILLAGLPIVLAARAVLEVVEWLVRAIA